MRLLLTFLLCAWFALETGRLWGQSVTQPPPVAIRSLSNTQGWDSSSYIRELADRIRPRWVSLTQKRIPGQVVIAMDLTRAGLAQNVRVIRAGDPLLSKAAIEAIDPSRPFPVLPDQFTGNLLSVELTFVHDVLRGLDIPRFRLLPPSIK